MKAFKKIINAVADAIIVVLLVFSVMLVASNANQQKTGVPGAFGYLGASVESDSMSGTFEKGDFILCPLAEKGDGYAVGDIVSFRQNVQGETIINTHRIVDVQEDAGVTYYVTQGDNRETCPAPDVQRKTQDDIIATYQGIRIAGLGSIVDFVRQPAGFILCAVLPILAVLAYEIVRLVQACWHLKECRIRGTAERPRGRHALPSEVV